MPIQASSAPRKPPTSSPLDGSTVSRLDTARKELLDLSLRNALLNFRPSRARGAEVTSENADEIVDALLSGAVLPVHAAADKPDQELGTKALPNGTSVPSLRARSPKGGNDELLVTNLPRDALEKRLLATWYAARTHVEERGFNILHLAVGMLEWYESDASDKALYAPLFLIPVELERATAVDRFKLKWTSEDIEPNLSLAEKLRADFGIQLPDFPDDEDLVPSDYFDAVSAAVEGQLRWKVLDARVALGFFSFAKLLMFRDLEPAAWSSAEGARIGSVMQSLLTDGFPDAGLSFEESTKIDKVLPPGNSSQVVDADSTQLLAVLEANAGRSLVIQGPPGTGKSQTITNLIADALSRGARVLFVAEKMAALEVVKRRLDEIHLGDACLELHSHTANKKSLLNELQRTVGLARPRVDEFSDRLAVLERSLDQLNAYADAMNAQIGQTRWTPFQVIGEMVRLRPLLKGVKSPHFVYADAGGNEGPSRDTVKIPAEFTSWTRSDLLERRPLIDNMQRLLADLGDPVQHPFYGSRLRAVLPSDKDRIDTSARQAEAAVQVLADAIDELGAFMGLTVSHERAEAVVLCSAARRALEAPHLKGIELRTGDWQARRDEIRAVLSAGSAHRELHERFGAVLIPEAWTQDLLSVRQVLATTGTKWWRALSGEYRQAKRSIIGLCKEAPKDATVARLLDLVDAVLAAQRHRAVIAQHASIEERLFGVQWQGERSDWSVLERITEWVIRLYRDIGDGNVPEGIVEFLSGAPSLEKLGETIRRVESALPVHESTLARLFETLEWHEGMRKRVEEAGDLDEQEGMLDAMIERLDEIDLHVRFNVYRDELLEAGLDWVVDLCLDHPKVHPHLVAVFRHVYFEGLLRQAMRERPALQRFDGQTHASTVTQFRTLDQQLLEHNRVRLAAEHCSSVPRLSGEGQAGILLREFEKKTRHLPIRKLMTRAGSVVQAIKPVMMMSPMSIAAFIPPGAMRFDVVIFDEASQVRPVEAFGAILRGEQLVVVGDSKQLPPTSFFDSLASDGDDGDRDDSDDNVAADMESILGLAVSRGVPQRMLRWHYRSRHESLIAVSNKEFYDSRLVVFPSPDAERHELGLRFHHLEATAYDRGKTRTNPLEAKAIAAAVLEHARRHPALTLGVAAFSLAQAQAVIDELELVRRGNPDVESFFAAHPNEPFFVKNLESVQGDERDVIFISVGYGRTSEGYVSMSFGPLNGEGGERRLNVLISRARRRCEVFTNLTHDDIDLSKTTSRGVAAFKTFLKYAQTGILDVPGVGSGEADSIFEEEVARALVTCGYRVAMQVGSAGFRIDLAVVDPERPGRYLLAIECDGAAYHSSRSARDRDRLRQQVLEGLGWRFHRIWSTDWFRSADAELKKTIAAIEAARIAEPVQAPAPTQPSTPIAREHLPVDAGTEQAAQPYSVATPAARVQGNGLHEVPVEHLANWIGQVVDIEGPVHVEEVWRRIAASAGVQRVGSRIQAALDSAAAFAERKGLLRRVEHFLWPPKMKAPVLRDRSGLPPASKKIAYVCSDEIALAIRHVVSSAFGIAADELPPSVGRLIGFGRVTEEMRSEITKVIGALEQSGELERVNGQLALRRAS